MRKSILFCCAIFLSLASAYGAKTIVVPKDKPTIQKALDASEEWDTVLVLNGTYHESVTMHEYSVLIGQDVRKTIISGNRGKPVIRSVNYTIIKNLTITNGEIGILCENTNSRIEHTIIRDNNTGIHCLVSLPMITNNIIYRNRWTGIFCELVTYAISTRVEHNIIAGNANCGIMLARKSAILIQNNVLFDNKQFGIYVDIDSRKSRLIYNNFYANRQPFNQFAVVDGTNQSRDPGYAADPFGALDFYRNTTTNPLKGLGKDGADIGLMSDADRSTIVSDSDKDGIPDGEDACVDVAEDTDGFEDTDGCPDYDNDYDAINDSKDACPTEAEDYDGFKDTDGCPDPDNDNDGICDPWVAEKGLLTNYPNCHGSEACPDLPETVNGYKDDDGCPDAPGDTVKPANRKGLK